MQSTIDERFKKLEQKHLDDLVRGASFWGGEVQNPEKVAVYCAVSEMLEEMTRIEKTTIVSNALRVDECGFDSLDSLGFTLKVEGAIDTLAMYVLLSRYQFLQAALED